MYFALKQISGAALDKYKKELRAHEKAIAKLQKGGHLVKLLVTFQHGENHYLMFEWADGDLQNFWKTRTAKEPLLADKWAAQQCYGLATALKQIHGMATWQRKKRESSPLSDEYGIHGDIKPENILWFSSYGDHNSKDHLVVSDLGLTRYHSFLTRSKVMPSNLDGFSEDYRPPEMDLNNQEHVTRKSDVWSLGCVYLELCTWYLRGFDGIQEFEYRRDEGDVPDTRTYLPSHLRNQVHQAKFFNVATNANGLKTAALKMAVEDVRT